MHNLYEISAPGQIITFSYQLYACLFVWVNKRRFSVWKTVLLQLVLCGITVLVAALVESPDYRFYLPRFFGFLGATLLIMFLCMDASFSKCAYFLPSAFVLAEFSTALDWHLYYYGTAIKGVADIPQIRAPFFISVYGMICTLAYLEGRRLRMFYCEMTVNSRDLLQAYLLAAMVFLVSNISNLSANTPFSSTSPSQIFMIRTLVDFAGVIAMFLLHIRRKEYTEQLRSERMRQTMEQMYDNYRMSRESIYLVSEKYHDLKHQIAYLRGNCRDEDRMAALDQLECEIRSFEAQADTGNEILDTLVVSRRMAGVQEGIQLTCIADGRRLSFISGMDLSALFGNLLDNAVEAVRKIPLKDGRLINLSVEEKRGFLLILCENRCAGDIHFENGLPQTDKTDRENHGIGTGSIRNISRKYGGEARFSVEEGWFRVKVLIPLPDSGSS